MTEQLTHPASELMEAFALGTLDESRYPEIESHLSQCAECQAYAASVPGDTFVTMLASARTVLEEKPALELPIPVEPPPELAAHSRYKPSRLLGVGGMGTVWLAEHELMGRQVAIKVIRPEFLAKPGAVGRFRREVAAAARLHHPNIVTAFDAEQAGGAHFLAMEYIDGVGLDDLLKEKGALPVAEACRYIADAARGLDHAHKLKLVHRDVKPSNLMRTADGQVKILDFGLAMIVADDRADTSITGANMVVGTPDYIAPEQAEHPHAADCRADIYSLGCTLYQLLSGQVPFPGVSVLKKLDAQRREEPKPLRQFRSDMPRGLSEIVMKMMAKNPALRYQTASEVAEALKPFTVPMSAIQRVRTQGRRLARIAAGFLALAMLAGGVVYRIQTDKGELVISTDSEDVEVVVKQAGKQVAIIDTKTNKRIELKSGEYDLEVKGAEGLKLDISKATLMRGKEVLARIERVDGKVAAKDGPPIQDVIRYEIKATYALTPQPAAIWPPKELPAPGFMTRLPIDFAVSNQSFTLSPDNLLAAHNQSSRSLMILESATGKTVNEIRLTENIFAWTFTPDSKAVILAVRGNAMVFSFRKWDIQSGRDESFIAPVRLQSGVREIDVTPDMNRLLVQSPTGRGSAGLAIFDVAKGRIVHQVASSASGNRRLLSKDRTRMYAINSEGRPRPTDPKEPKPSLVIEQFAVLCLDDLTKPADQVKVEISGFSASVFESADGSAIGILSPVEGGRHNVTMYDSRTLKKLSSIASPDLGPGLKKPIAARYAPRAIFESNTGFEAIDLTGDFKRHPIANLPNHDATVLSDDGQVFGTRTETGWNLYRLPEVGKAVTAKVEPAKSVLEKATPKANSVPVKEAVIWPPKELPAKPGFMTRLDIKYASTPNELRFSPDSRLVAILQPGLTKIPILATAMGQVVNNQFYNAKTVAIAFTADSRNLVQVNSRGTNLYEFELGNIATGKQMILIPTVRLQKPIVGIYASPDLKRLIVDTQSDNRSKNTYVVFDVAKGQITHQFDLSYSFHRTSKIFSLDGTCLYSQRVDVPQQVGPLLDNPPEPAILLRKDDLTNPANSIQMSLPKAVYGMFESLDGTALSLLTSNEAGTPIVESYDASTLKKLKDVEINEPHHLPMPRVASRAARAIIQHATGFEAVDLTGDFKRYPIANLPNCDATILSDDGRVFGARTETGWNLYRLPDVASIARPQPPDNTIAPPPALPGGEGKSGVSFQGQDAPASHWPPAELPSSSPQAVRLPIEYSRMKPVFSPDAKLVGVFRPRSFYLDIFESATGKLLASRFRSLKGGPFEEPMVRQWCFSSDSTKVLCAMKAGADTIAFEEWDLKSGDSKKLSDPIRYTEEISSLQWSADLSKIILGGPKAHRVWDLKERRISRIVPHEGPAQLSVVFQDFTPPEIVVSADGTKLYKLQMAIHPLIMRTKPDQNEPANFTRLVIESLVDDAAPQTFEFDQATNRLIESSSGELILMRVPLLPGQEIEYEFVDRQTGQRIGRLWKQASTGQDLWARHAHLMVRIGGDGKFHLVDIRTNKEVPFDSPVHVQREETLLSPNGKMLAVNTETGWNLYRLPDVAKAAIESKEMLPMPSEKK